MRFGYRGVWANVGMCEQRAIRQFLKVRTSYDVLPVSFRLVILDTSLLVNKSLGILVQNGEFPPILGSYGNEIAGNGEGER